MATWKEDVVKALENLGGKAHRLEIIKEVEKLRPDNLNKDVVATVQKELEVFSKSSKNFRGGDENEIFIQPEG